MKLPIGLFIGISLWSCAWSAFLRILKQEAVDKQSFFLKKKKKKKTAMSSTVIIFTLKKTTCQSLDPRKKIAVIV